METRVESAEVKAIAERLLSTEKELAYIRNSRVRIAYLESDRERVSNRRTIYGVCQRTPGQWQWSIPYDFAITIYSPNTERFNDEQMEALVFHELLHVGVDKDGNEEIYYSVPHDYEEFEAIIEQYGLRWSE